MRISSNMIQSSQDRMYASDVYQKHIKDDEDNDSTASETGTKYALTDNTILVQNEDTYSIELIGDSDERTLLQEIAMDSDYGQQLKQLVDRTEKETEETEFTRLNTSIKAMNLSDYI